MLISFSPLRFSCHATDCHFRHYADTLRYVLARAIDIAAAFAFFFFFMSLFFDLSTFITPPLFFLARLRRCRHYAITILICHAVDAA